MTIAENISWSSVLGMAADEQACQEIQGVITTDYNKRIDEGRDERLEKMRATSEKFIDPVLQSVGCYYCFYLIDKLNTVAQKTLVSEKEHENRKS